MKLVFNHARPQVLRTLPHAGDEFDAKNKAACRYGMSRWRVLAPVKSTALVTGTLTGQPNLPETLRQGLFAIPCDYSVLAYSLVRQAYFDKALSLQPAHSLATHRMFGSLMRAEAPTSLDQVPA